MVVWKQLRVIQNVDEIGYLESHECKATELEASGIHFSGTSAANVGKNIAHYAKKMQLGRG